MSYTVKRLILSGKLKRGQKLSLNRLARDLNTTIPIIAPTFKQLEKEGLIISKGKKGSFVALPFNRFVGSRCKYNLTILDYQSLRGI
jgi:DNA-binding transcriptional regulator YhcF (GntR family)